MIFIKEFRGRFGNNLFQIATALSIAKHNNDIVYIPNSWQYKEYFPENDILKYGDVNSFDIKYEYIETIHGYNNIPYQYNMNLFGYFESYLYFDYIRDELINIHFNMNNENIQRENKIRKLPEYDKNQEIVVINVRLGDFFEYPDKHVIQSKEYYMSAINYFLNINPDYNFFIVSDDIKLCEEIYGSIFNTTLVYYIPETIVGNFCLLTECQHIIMSSSTFSWWGAYLNKNKNKKIIIPKKWFGELYKEKDTSGYYLPEYISM